MSGTLYILPFPKDVIAHKIKESVSTLGGPTYQFGFKNRVPILAARAGTVFEARCSRVNFLTRMFTSHESGHNTNYVTILHDDDTYARYVHLNPSVNINEKVDAGDLLGTLYGDLRGQHHIHFQVYRYDDGYRIYLPVDFD